jgi:predicted nucleic acid-binding protein
MKVYCDTCVYIYAFNLNPPDKMDKLRPQDQLARNFFTQVEAGTYQLVVSDWVKDEFRKVIGSDKMLQGFIDGINNKIEITKTEEDVNKARKLSQNNFPDALHVVLALKAESVILTTENLRDFAEFQRLIKIYPPGML